VGSPSTGLDPGSLDDLTVPASAQENSWIEPEERGMAAWSSGSICNPHHSWLNAQEQRGYRKGHALRQGTWKRRTNWVRRNRGPW